MATLKIRDVPKGALEVIRLRARAVGQSRQAYLRAWVIEMAARPTEQEAIAAVEAAPAGAGSQH